MRASWRSGCRGLAVAGLLALSGCGPQEMTAANLGEDTGMQTATAQSALFTPTPACRGDKYVGVRTLDRCPLPLSGSTGQWTVRSGISGLTGQFSAAPPVAPGLSRFCIYEWHSNTGTPTAPPEYLRLPREGNRSAPQWLSPDCHVISPVATPELSDAPTIYKPLIDTALRMYDTVALPVVKGMSQTRVAVIDSAVDGYVSGRAGSGAYGHGHAVGRLIRELSCPEDGLVRGAPCIGMVSNHLALSKISPTQSDTVNGGYFGSQLELAEAIVRSVYVWAMNYVATGTQPRLVVNLSLGWEEQTGAGGSFPGMQFDTLPGPARAVHAALVHASCLGALVVASAGNVSGGAVSQTGAIFPGAWESKRAPTLDECKSFEGSWLAPFGKQKLLSTDDSVYKPLVHAVGAVDATDRPLSITRPGGRSRLASHGFQVVSTDGTGKATNPMTGTSMSAAAVSGIAATIWGYRPELPASEVMAWVYKSGTSLSPSPEGTPVTADFCNAASCTGFDIRRPSLCQALASACSSPVDRCPEVPPTCVRNNPAYAGKNPSWVPEKWDAAWATMGALTVPAPAAACADPLLCPAPVNSFPTLTATPWVGPQPGQTGCDVCGLSGNTLFVSVSPSFPAWNDAALTVQTTNGVNIIPLGAILTPLAATSFQVMGLPLAGGTVQGATLSFANGAGTSTAEPILVW